jgi:hypothetical protein
MPRFGAFKLRLTARQLAVHQRAGLLRRRSRKGGMSSSGCGSGAAGCSMATGGAGSTTARCERLSVRTLRTVSASALALLARPVASQVNVSALIRRNSGNFVPSCIDEAVRVVANSDVVARLPVVNSDLGEVVAVINLRCLVEVFGILGAIQETLKLMIGRAVSLAEQKNRREGRAIARSVSFRY